MEIVLILLSPWLADSPLWLRLAIAGAWLALVALTAEWLHRTNLAGSETVRKVVHIGAGNVILLAWWLNIPAWVGIGVSIVAGIITFLSYYVPILPSINGVGRRSLGTFFYAVSIGVLVGWFWAIQEPQYAALGILIMTWGDGLACIVGQRFGQHPYKIWGMQKSWEGSLAMLLISFTISSVILLSIYGNLGQVWVISGVVAAVATALEAFSKFGIDNLTVPIGSAALSFALGQFLLLG